VEQTGTEKFTDFVSNFVQAWQEIDKP